jgi:hypothetical protein
MARIPWVKVLSSFGRKAPRPPREARKIAHDFARFSVIGSTPYTTPKGKMRWTTGHAPTAQPHLSVMDYLKQIREDGYSRKPPFVPLITRKGKSIEEFHPKVVRKTLNRLADHIEEMARTGPRGGKFIVTKSGRKRYIP